MHRARKRFGQHFLVDASIIDAIVGAIDPRAGESLIEIGPGLGALTRPLVERAQTMTVIELDRDLAARLRRDPRLNVVESDVLRVDFAQMAGTAPLALPTLRIVGNLPYNISTPILFHLAASAACVRDQHVMLQKEVVDRMVAVPSTKAYGRLSVMLQWRYTIDHVLDVPPSAFDPPPRVDSAVVCMRPRQGDALHDIDERVLGDIVTVAFSQRRKLLRHTLGAWLLQRGMPAGFDVQRRAEEVSVAEYLDLARCVDVTRADVTCADRS
jgi:16S rRNA (adenine1518-N6/adenine1519-N6)-dimethyltransferase